MTAAEGCADLQEDGVLDAARVAVLQLLKGLPHLIQQGVIMGHAAHNCPQSNLYHTQESTATMDSHSNSLQASCN